MLNRNNRIMLTMFKDPIYSMLQYMKTTVKRTSKFSKDKSVDNSSMVDNQYIDEVLRNTVRFQTKASKNVNTTFEIQKALKEIIGKLTRRGKKLYGYQLN
ncbi:unnamed protein product [Acanthoscelides obtectus]|uniref:Uncharacterized protein n=1 Tax=Acanthoscelides obtectus TaxID=200917 RepID=A0A9P0LU13_ACAOB|nr:unnamed protein product [Acanthoscelides obtectus]CAK1668587.1 hypothetical protein AOBTE_LOCUS26501 [Acanthoscelides obtectus]